MNNTICFFNSAKEWGGGEKWHFEMASLLHADGLPVIVVANHGSELLKRLKNTEVKVIPLNISNLSFLNPFTRAKIRKIFSRECVRSVIVNLPADLKAAGIVAKKADLKNFIYRRGSAIPIKNRWLNRYLFKNVVTGIIANSVETKNTILENDPALFDADDIKVIYNGIDIDAYLSTPITKVYDKTPNELVIGNIGRLVRQKAQHFLLDVAAELKNSGVAFKCIIGGEGHLKDSLFAYAEKKDVLDRVIFHGFVDDVRSFMESIDVFVLTSLWEGFGYVLAEAMACGKPVVAFDVSSNPEIVEHNKTGYLVPMNDTKKLAENIIHLYNSKEKYDKMSKAGIKRVREKFSIEMAKQKVKNILNREH